MVQALDWGSTSVPASVTTSDGVTLRFDRTGGGRRVLCLHAMMTDGRYFGARRENGFVHALGCEAIVADFRGHGESVPPVAGRDDWSFDDLVDKDLPALADGAEAIIGHSLGGLVALAGIATGVIAPPRRLVLVATSVWLGGGISRTAIMAAYRGVTALFGKAPIKALHVGTADEARSYVAQLTGWQRSGRWTSLGGRDYMTALETVDVPTLVVAGAGDWMCRPDDAAAIGRRIRGSQLRIVGTAHGDPLDPDHFQLFTRPELTALRAEISAFVTS